MNDAGEPTLSLEEQAIAGAYVSDVTRNVIIDKQVPQYFVATIGLVGAGKTTVLKKMNEHLRIVRVSSDELRERLHDASLDVARAPYVALYVITQVERAGFSIIADADAVQKVARDEIAERERRGIYIFWLKVDAPGAIIENRLRLRNFSPSPLFDDAEHALAVLNERKFLHEKYAIELAKLPYIYTFDTSQSSLDSQVIEAVGLIKDRLQHAV